MDTSQDIQRDMLKRTLPFKWSAGHIEWKGSTPHDRNVRTAVVHIVMKSRYENRNRKMIRVSGECLCGYHPKKHSYRFRTGTEMVTCKACLQFAQRIQQGRV